MIKEGYPAIEQEALAIKWATEDLSYCLVGSPPVNGQDQVHNCQDNSMVSFVAELLVPSATLNGGPPQQC